MHPQYLQILNPNQCSVKPALARPVRLGDSAEQQSNKLRIYQHPLSVSAQHFWRPLAAEPEKTVGPDGDTFQQTDFQEIYDALRPDQNAP